MIGHKNWITKKTRFHGGKRDFDSIWFNNFDKQVAKYWFWRIIESNRSDRIEFEEFVPPWEPQVPRNPSMARKIVRCRRLLQRREVAIARGPGPPKRPQRDLWRPLVQPRPSPAPQKNPRPPQTQFFVVLYLQRHASTLHITSSLITSIATLPSLFPARGFRAASYHPTDPKSDGLLAGAGRKNQPPPPALRGRRVPALASLVAIGVFVDPFAYWKQCASPDRTSKTLFFSESNSIFDI